MGADVYLNSVYEQTKQAWEPLFDLAVRARDVSHMNDELKALVTSEVKGRAAELEASKPDLAKQMMATLEGWRGGGRVEKMQVLVSLAYELMYSKGYFRDSYNQTNLLWRLGLSYWKDLEGWLDGEGHMSIANMRAFADIIKGGDIVPVGKMEGDERLIEDTDGYRASDWQAYFEGKRRDLLELLATAIKKREPLYFSV